MATVRFTQNIQRHVRCPSQEAAGDTVRQVLDAVFRENETARMYVLDEHGEVRKHMVIFVDGKPIRDRAKLSDPVASTGSIHIMQALSGG